MAASLPVVSVSVGYIKNMVSAGNQKLITPLNVENAFISIMEELTLSKELKIELGTQNLNHVKEKYDRLIMYKKYAKLWGID